MKCSKAYISVMLLSSFIMICCKDGSSSGTKQSVGEENGQVVKSIENIVNAYDLTANDDAISAWFMRQAFSIGVISSDEQNKQTISFEEFSMRETKAEDVIGIQRQTIEKFMESQGVKDKFTKLDQWFEAQHKAEKTLLEFINDQHLATPDKIRNLVQIGEYHTDILSRQKCLLEFIRQKRDASSKHE